MPLFRWYVDVYGELSREAGGSFKTVRNALIEESRSQAESRGKAFVDPSDKRLDLNKVKRRIRDMRNAQNAA